MATQEIKPLTTFAPPPPSAVATVVVFVGLAIYNFPIFDDPDPHVFTKRIFPDVLSINALIFLRAFFALVCFFGFAFAWAVAPIPVLTPYRPGSRCPRIPFQLTPWVKQYFFTSWSWNILGVCFALASYIGYQTQQGHSVNPYLIQFTLILWEVAAPMTLLIGAIVKYVLWPASIKSNGNGAVFLRPLALLQHNANVIMAVTDAALMGGLPVRYSHLSLSVLYGCSYIVFAWGNQLRWHGQGPAFPYFFMDTTLGNTHTVALYGLFAVLMAFHGVFCGVETILHWVGNNLLGHAAFAVFLCASVCRFRD